MSAIVPEKKKTRPRKNDSSRRSPDSPRLVSDDEYLAILAKNNGGYELVDGRLVDLRMSMESDLVALMVARLLFAYAEKCGGVATAEASYRLFPNRPCHYRRPDASFFWPKRLTGGKIPRRGYPQLAPDLVVEVVSPDDAADELQQKISEYLEAGVRMIWVVFPLSQAVQVYTAPKEVKLLHSGDKLEGGKVLPGFSCLVREFFAFPAPLEEGPAD